MILKLEAIESISKKLELSYTGIEQDWDIEMANPDRLKEFLSYLKNTELDESEKIAMMSLIIASFEDLLNEDETNESQCELWKKIKIMLESDFDLFSDIITYWSLFDEKEKANVFAVTHYIRTVKK